MSLKNILYRLYAKIMKLDPPKIYTDEEKKEFITKLIDSYEHQNRDIFTVKKKYIEDIEIEKIDFNYFGGWLFKKDENPSDKIIYYIHGGGFTGACTRERIAFVSYLVKKFHYNVFSIDYRLSPKVKAPVPLNDCLEGYRYLLKTYPSKNIVLIGESAGGNLVLTLSLMLKDKGIDLPKAVYANSAPTQFIEYYPSYQKFSMKEDFIVVSSIIENTYDIYMKKEEAKDPYISPLYGNLQGLPPIVISVSECECLLDDSLRMYEKLKEASNQTTLLTYPKMCHAFIISPQMRRVRKYAYPDLEKFLNNNLKEIKK